MAMTDPAAFDPAARFVRLVEVHSNGMVEFEFAVGEPELYVEMLMPRAQFEDFCVQQGVTPTEGALPEASIGTDEHEWDWSLRAARAHHFRNQT